MSAPSIPLGAVLENIEVELGGMALRCEALQDAAGTGARAMSGDPERQAALLVAFQELDALTQSLVDLAGLAGLLGRSTIGRLRLDRARIRGQLRLNSLSERLLGEASDEDEDQDGFLL